MRGTTLFVALDGLLKDELTNIETATLMDGEVEGNFGFKVNLDWLLCRGLNGLRARMGNRPFFADTKTWNGKRTMTDIAKMLVDAGVDYFNAWVQADDQLDDAVKAVKGSYTKILGVTVLTHYNDAWCRKYFGRGLQETVEFLTKEAKERGLHGVILPGTCLHGVRGIDLIKAVPGIRMEEFKDDRHQQEVTPEFAVRNGAKIIVCGSPIMKVANKVSALRQILARMQTT